MLKKEMLQSIPLECLIEMDKQKSRLLYPYCFIGQPIYQLTENNSKVFIKDNILFEKKNARYIPWMFKVDEQNILIDIQCMLYNDNYYIS